MRREDVISFEGTVIEILADRRFRVELPNGHRLLAFGSRRTRLEDLRVGLGDKLSVEVSPFDLSKGRIKNKEVKI